MIFRRFGAAFKFKVSARSIVPVALFFIVSRSVAVGQESTASWKVERPNSESGLANAFIMNSGGPADRPLTHLKATKLKLQAQLLTPLNSSFNRQGDVILAIVTAAPDGDLGRVLWPGAILEGSVSRARPASRLQTSGKVIVNFYRAYVGDTRIALDVQADSDSSPISLPNMERRAGSH